MLMARIRYTMFGRRAVVFANPNNTRDAVSVVRYYGVAGSVDLVNSLWVAFRLLFGPPVILRSGARRWGRFFRYVPGVFWCDEWLNPKAAWELCNISEMAMPTHQIRRDMVSVMLSALTRDKLDKAYVFGTGKSLERAGLYDWSDGFRIVCNTIVKDADLWSRMNPHVFVAGDALYHFCHSSHAQAFLADLIARFTERPCWFVYFERFDPIVRTRMAQWSEWLVPVPQTRCPVHRCVRHSGSLPAGVGNVLPALLLPVAWALSRDVRLFGFDGRSPNDKLFWRNSAPHSYPELIEELKKTFPAFYEANVPTSDPMKYVRAVHGDALERILQDAGSDGYSVKMLHESYTEVLQRRFDPSACPRMTPVVKG